MDEPNEVWKEGQLKDVAIVVMGQSPKGESCTEDSSNGTALLNGPTEFGIRFPTPVQYTSAPTRFSVPDDVLFCVRGSTTGRMNWSDREYVIGRGLAAIRHKSGKDFQYFVRGVLDHNLQSLLNTATGSTFPSVSREQIEGLEILIPPLVEQRSIASLLSSFDDKVDLLHRQNKTLEALAETVFREWFLRDSVEKVPITHYVEFNPIRKLSKGSVAPYLDMAGVSTSTFNPTGWYDREFTSGTKFRNDDTLLARITPCLENGKTAFVTFLRQDQVGWGSTEFIVMRSKETLSTFFTYTLARNQDFRDYAEGCMAGSSGRQRVDVEHLQQFQLGRVDPDSMREFNRILTSIPPKLHQNMLQINTLQKIRDTLLPKLMSGEVRAI